ncbi:failed axon connections homolog [Saccoglossus kowalevskii]|uniref:Failed axon connections homolog n=1 Tax=Saccoglossus kowalevskii TaxID=10224 RepID=A0ABM0H1W4_SACKO|nr:PREDICTED: failed axon connections homolog [Saccoglossus kowalevskii]
MPRSSYPPNTAILFQMGRAKHTPSLSPFAIKLETYLRMAEIPYKSVHTRKKSSKGETPWITYNEETIPSQAQCIDILNKKCDKNLNKELSDWQRSMAKAFQRLTEESLYWTLLYARWIDRDYCDSMRDSFPSGFMMDIYLWREKGQVEKALQYQGTSKHTKDEIYDIALTDIKALSEFLGPKQYFFGDEVSEFDAALFGFVATFAYELPGSPQERFIKGECKNLLAFCERIKERYWPDWKKCIMGNKTIDDYPAIPKTDPTVFNPTDDESTSTSTSNSKSSSGRSSKSSNEDANAKDQNDADAVVAAPTTNATGTQLDATETTQEPTQEPAQQPTQKPAQKPTQEPTQEAAQEPTQEPAQSAENVVGEVASAEVLEKKLENMQEKIAVAVEEKTEEIKVKVEEAVSTDTSDEPRPTENTEEPKPDESTATTTDVTKTE